MLAKMCVSAGLLWKAHLSTTERLSGAGAGAGGGWRRLGRGRGEFLLEEGSSYPRALPECLSVCRVSQTQSTHVHGESELARIRVTVGNRVGSTAETEGSKMRRWSRLTASTAERASLGLAAFLRA